MKLKFAMTLGLILAIPLAQAAPVPSVLAKSIKGYDTKSTSFDKGVLKVVIVKDVVTQEIYKNIAMSTCYPLWSDKKVGWGKTELVRVEVKNSIDAAGFALTNVREACGVFGKATNASASPYWSSHTLVCVAGNPCRARRAGEVTAGD